MFTMFSSYYSSIAPDSFYHTRTQTNGSARSLCAESSKEKANLSYSGNFGEPRIIAKDMKDKITIKRWEIFVWMLTGMLMISGIALLVMWNA